MLHSSKMTKNEIALSIVEYKVSFTYMNIGGLQGCWYRCFETDIFWSIDVSLLTFKLQFSIKTLIFQTEGSVYRLKNSIEHYLLNELI